ncbi:MAG: hypothetical protein LBQ51_10830 [Desulfovibrio sp.]|jgi:hypothetical protein|nr:hypothetical protein [Desulfovibrio sp.]
MPEAQKILNAAHFLPPLLLALVAVLLFCAGFTLNRRNASPFPGRLLYYPGGLALTAALVALLTVLRRAGVPDATVAALPLIITLLYLGFGLLLRKPAIFTLGLALPLLWMLLMKIGEALSGLHYTLYNLPEEPFWYLLAAPVILGLRRLKKPAGFWEEAECSLVVTSACCLMCSFWLMAIGRPSLLTGLGLPAYAWALGLTAVSALFLWCAKYLEDIPFGACSLAGSAAGVYTLVSSWPWK